MKTLLTCVLVIGLAGMCWAAEAILNCAVDHSKDDDLSACPYSHQDDNGNWDKIFDYAEEQGELIHPVDYGLRCEKMGAVEHHVHDIGEPCPGVVEVPEVVTAPAESLWWGGGDCFTRELNIANTCIVDGDKKYVLEIAILHEGCLDCVVLTGVGEANIDVVDFVIEDGVTNAPTEKIGKATWGKLLLREVTKCPCK